MYGKVTQMVYCMFLHFVVTDLYHKQGYSGHKRLCVCISEHTDFVKRIQYGDSTASYFE